MCDRLRPSMIPTSACGLGSGTEHKGGPTWGLGSTAGGMAISAGHETPHYQTATNTKVFPQKSLSQCGSLWSLVENKNSPLEVLVSFLCLFPFFTYMYMLSILLVYVVYCLSPTSM